jgi:hypothetical protein
MLAVLPDSTEIPPDGNWGGYHGTSHLNPEDAVRDGLPRRGTSRSLLEHVRGAADSAFRGATAIPSDPVNQSGAAYWAGEDGIVYEVRYVPTWDVNKALEGRVLQPDGTFGGNPARGENEFAISAHVPRGRIKKWGTVDADRRGRLFVRTWNDNPNHREP